MTQPPKQSQNTGTAEGKEKKKREVKKMKTITFRPDPDVERLLSEAEEATGITRTDIINLALTKAIRSVVDEVASRIVALQRRLGGGGDKRG